MGNVWNDSFLKKEIIVKSPKLIAAEKKIYKLNFFELTDKLF